MPSHHETRLSLEFCPQIAITFCSGDSLTIDYMQQQKRMFSKGKTFIVDISYQVSGSRRPNKIKLENGLSVALDNVDKTEKTWGSLEEKVRKEQQFNEYTQDILHILSSWKAVTMIDALVTTPVRRSEINKLVERLDDNMFGAMGHLKEKVIMRQDGKDFIRFLLNKPDPLLKHMGMSLGVASPTLLQQVSDQIQILAKGENVQIQQRAQKILDQDVRNAWIYFPTEKSRSRM